MIIIATTMEEKTIWPIAHKAGEKRIYKVEYRHKQFTPNAVCRRGDILAPSVYSGKNHRVINTGMAGSEPVWVATVGQSSVSGEVTLVAVEDDCFVDSTASITAQQWSVVGNPADIVIDMPAMSGFETKIRVEVLSPTTQTEFELVNTITVTAANGDVEIFKKSIVVRVI